MVPIQEQVQKLPAILDQKAAQDRMIKDLLVQNKRTEKEQIEVTQQLQAKAKIVKGELD